MNLHSNNADIQYLVSLFQEDLDLFRQYHSKPQLDQASKVFIQAFISHIEKESETNHQQVTDFIDYGTKLMSHLAKSGVKNIEISNNGYNRILQSMINKEILKQPLEQALQRKKNNNGSKEDIQNLTYLIIQLQKKSIDYQKFKQRLGKVREL